LWKTNNEAPNKRAHNQQEEKQEESWRTPNIIGISIRIRYGKQK